jgi:hypothetical protein
MFVPTLRSEMQGQAVTVADGVSVVGEIKTGGGFNCISRTFRNNWLWQMRTLFSPKKMQGRQNHQSAPHEYVHS